MARRISRKHRLWVGGLAILTLFAVTAVPGSTAPTGAKNFSFAVSPGPVAQGDLNQTFSVTVTNTSPKNSSSNISSLSIQVPSQFTPTSASVAPQPASTNANLSAVPTIDSNSLTCRGGTSQTVNVCSLDPVKRLQKVTITIVADVTSEGLTCGSNQSGAWTVAPNTGSQLNGDSFTENPVNTMPYTSIERQCPLDWVQAPSDTTVSTNQTVTVAAYDDSEIDTSFNGTITIVVRSEPSANALTVTPSTLTAENGEQSFTLSGSAAGSYTIYATATGKDNAPDKSFTLYDINSSIAGQVWRDHNNNGAKNADEGGQSDWIVKAFEGTTEKGSATSADDGTYTISGLAAGTTYTVCEFAPAEETGYEYRGWIQSVPTANTLCAGFDGAEPNGYSVTFPGPAGSNVANQDFLNVRTITIPEPNTVGVDCGNLPPGDVFTVGDGVIDPVGTITVDPDNCKPGEYVFETWTSGDEQFAEFYPAFDTTGTTPVPFTETYEWIINGDRTQQTLNYDDDGAGGVPFREMLFCEVNANGDFTGFPDPVAPDTAPHTSCLLGTSEVPKADDPDTETVDEGGVLRKDTVYTLIDGQRSLR